MKIAYNESVEVTQKQFKIALTEFSGLIAHRKSNNKFYIKVLVPKWSSHIANRLSEYND